MIEPKGGVKILPVERKYHLLKWYLVTKKHGQKVAEPPWPTVFAYATHAIKSKERIVGLFFKEAGIRRS
jgi:hypothetical protein